MIIVTGGTGKLGTELKKLLPDALFPTSDEFNITYPKEMHAYMIDKGKDCNVLIHAAALTSPPVVDKVPLEAMSTNITGVTYLVSLCSLYNIKLVYISTDYVYDGRKGNYNETDPVRPINKYAWSKLGGECAVMMYDNSLIIRTSFTPVEFPYDAAFVDQYSSREPVDTIAKKILHVMNKATGIINIGGERMSVYEYAKTLKPTVAKINRNDVIFDVPYDTSMDCNKFNKLL